MSSSFNPITEALHTNATNNVDGNSHSGIITYASLQHNSDNSLGADFGRANDGNRKPKKMIGWKTLVEDEEKSLALLIILNENKAHVSDQKKHYDDLICVTFHGHLNSNGKRDGNALFWIIKSGKKNIPTER